MVKETQGVTVATYGKSRNFPSFFTPDSGFLSPLNVDTPLKAAQIIGKYLIVINHFI